MKDELQTLEEIFQDLTKENRKILLDFAKNLQERQNQTSGDRKAGPVAFLSDEELQILKKVVAGKTDAEISHALSIKETKVKLYLEHISDKLGVSSRKALAIQAVRKGLVER